ncbi:hypothetical protein C3747_40g28 [Trypanosoma cruzi]|uniref:Uncharacterized protein n=2 Tax=Trypanosoma cruzi TaxID=5693 RepID=Q4DIW1_TRYCC|nr:hypothetical protein, conserved [Trypanosoma cruzi]EAN92455.1 hypothetical protein, conserved [Trypanosoma cruzi]PWV13908.1 hypothetical protein C3747_40g28 [Trypanosoma cruzi]RNC59594.1 hypothetical protein TcCL_ESM02797 [Trypanosoma cruzi]|eukprot:XP_814306.1 hypothetical protein [Trypanosoma cruzi strain CL Brener]
MLEAQSCRGNGQKVNISRSSEAVLGPPPVYDDICRFVAEYAGRLPRNAFTGTAPYEYTGCDYALILYAIMPSRCIDLSSLCWSTTPLPAQLESNLAVFCEGCCGLQLCDAPLSSLHPHCLRCSPTCIVHHIKVQHWLFVLSQRFPPEGSFDAVTLRMELRHTQLGEPRLATSHALSSTDVHIASTNGEDEFSLPSLHCHVIWKAPAVAVPENAERGTAAVSEAKTPKTRRGAGDDEIQRKPWRSAARPWRTASTIKLASQRTERTSLASQPSSNDCANSSSTICHNLADQWVESERRRLQLKENIAHARQTLQCTLFANGTIDFDDILSILQQKQH